MIEVNNLIKFLKKNRIEFFTGVPDSILKNFSLKIENYSSKKHIITTNEGSAVALGAGYYLSKKIAFDLHAKFRFRKRSKSTYFINPQKCLFNPHAISHWVERAPGTKDEVQHSEKEKLQKNY